MTTSELHKALYNLVDCIRYAEKQRDYMTDKAAELDLQIESVNDYIKETIEKVYSLAEKHEENAEDFLRYK